MKAEEYFDMQIDIHSEHVESKKLNIVMKKDGIRFKNKDLPLITYQQLYQILL